MMTVLSSSFGCSLWILQSHTKKNSKHESASCTRTRPSHTDTDNSKRIMVMAMKMIMIDGPFKLTRVPPRLVVREHVHAPRPAARGIGIGRGLPDARHGAAVARAGDVEVLVRGVDQR